MCFPSLRIQWMVGVVGFGISGVLLAEPPPLIDLSKPVSQSLPQISGIYWNFDTDMGPDRKVEDASGNGYHGIPMAGNGAMPALTSGVDRAGASGFGKAVKFAAGEGAEGNPRVIVNLPVENRLAMVGRSFTGGVWVRFESVGEGEQRTLLIDKGGFNTKGGDGAGHFCLSLVKNKSGAWQVAFQTGDGTANVNAVSGQAEPWNLQDGQWHHIGFNFHHRPEARNSVSFWLNGKMIGEAPAEVNLTSGHTSATNRRLSVGERTTSNFASRLDGAVDDLFLTEGVYHFKPIVTQ